MVSPRDSPYRGDYVAKRGDGAFLVKRYDKAYRRILVGRWVLFDKNGVCLSHRLFFDKSESDPPYDWADKKLRDRLFLTRCCF